MTGSNGCRWPGLLLIALLIAVPPAADLPAQGSPGQGVVVVFMSGFFAGPNPGLATLQTSLQAAFAALPGQQLSTQLFPWNDLAGASAFAAGTAPGATVVFVGHSWGAAGLFSLAQQGLTADLCVALDWVSTQTPFTATTPPAPAGLLRTLNYHQVSTSFLEPVPAAQILGAERNLDVEVLLDDPGITHTSIDCDPRVHALVTARILELVSPSPYPGTGDDLDLLLRIDTPLTACVPGGGLLAAGVLSDHAVRSVTTGDLVSLRSVSPGGLLAGSPGGVLGEIFPSAVPPSSLVTGIAGSLDPATTFLLVPGPGLQLAPFAPVPLPAAGFDLQLCWPAGLQGTSILLQAIALDGNATNGLFATSGGLELRGI